MTGGRPAPPRLHVVTDDEIVRGRDFPARARAILEAGGPRLALHLRHRAADRVVYRLARSLVAAAAPVGASVIVSRRADLARAAGAHGAHLGRGAIPAGTARALLGARAWLGASIHDPSDAPAADRRVLDYLVVGPVFPTETHPGRQPLGATALAEATGATALPVVAIGGVTPDRVRACLEAGAWGVAVVRAVWGAPDPAAAVAALSHRLEEA